MFLFLDHVQLIQVLYGILLYICSFMPSFVLRFVLLCLCLSIMIVCRLVVSFTQEKRDEKWEQHNGGALNYSRKIAV